MTDGLLTSSGTYSEEVMTIMADTAVGNERGWLAEYFEQFRTKLGQDGVLDQLVALKAMMMEAHVNGRKVIIAGNGGSAAIASHCAVDFTKNAGIRCVNFNEADLITCLANDYGYDRWLAKALELYADDGDLVVLISSSGRSANIVRAAEHTVGRRLGLVTLSGFAADNPLRALGGLNLWVDSRAYNIVEMTHHIWLLAVCDLIIGAAEYPAVQEHGRARVAEPSVRV